ncbi:MULTISPECIES: type 1 glutamine amidotransferase domain-containing protein [unclassified Cupriavidus]|uniref:type 1 glutamine amidotransferase domain-containing protein n=1 Tax=unclassified Cupriavidus TaxID=2640874 RepID=UPI001C006EB2|nr:MULTISPECIES: type 1 glutamine amidotransferase domain-containing protein [unclassified Cupriavidus]MCA3182089.1 type 1 glutamine amidotransferase domain-containing protein [Cupriavidus sp.]MCA3193308.1 type 1 glutamine amidotransferase domain-containing protein [Cupriavidus sp.]MCA3200374.1 type 1 glutamine amidotransferase domain-containing protein [Cupriavidus sp.]MCA3204420.1 type 1 glutamine amidotransferase domain-containing protein [Cupriavidus sp.]MCA3236122.1 type 1 glutamine amido
MKILMVLTSHDTLGNTGKKTGFWLEEFAAPYYVFKDAGVDVTLAAPKGGQPPIDPKSDEPDFKTDATRRFQGDAAAQKHLAATLTLDQVKADDFDAVFYPGGHGPLWDLTEDKRSIALLEAFDRAGKPMALVCHAPGVLRHVKRADGEPLVKGRRVTGFTNTEEDAVQLTNVVPYLVEDMLKANGGQFSRTDDWGSYAVVDGLLVTGQNPASSEAGAHELLKLLKK